VAVNDKNTSLPNRFHAITNDYRRRIFLNADADYYVVIANDAQQKLDRVISICMRQYIGMAQETKSIIRLRARGESSLGDSASGIAADDATA
jgi:hypothetical protein